MNNKPKALGEDSAMQTIREQQVWERLQNEAVAAQRWRLEQEMEQARVDGSYSGQSWITNSNSSGRLVVFAVVSFIVITLAGTIAYTW